MSALRTLGLPVLLSWQLWALSACLDREAKMEVLPVEAPSNFDLGLCVNITVPSDPTLLGATRAQCGACCLEGGLPDSSFILDNACVCADLPPLDSDTAVCAEEVRWPQECSVCCEESRYADSSEEGGECACLGAPDAEVCAGAFDYTDPELACVTCCVEEGYLGLSFEHTSKQRRCVCTR